ncbi:MAG: hypothetical protein M3Y21_09165 [Candidatus Eremiobacteraeota bacterium]|nr:hypothetical protein [Candidatus Eremiobacteraeota bacterium]
MLRTLICTCLALTAFQPATAATWQPLGSAFVKIMQPAAADLDAAQFGTRQWKVRFHNGVLEAASVQKTLDILPFPPSVDTATLGAYGTQPAETLRVRNGWLAAYDHGEFGGALWQFSSDGSSGHRLLQVPTDGLIQYHDEVLAETGSAAPFFFKPLRIHRFAFREGNWQEIGHVDFPYDIVQLKILGGELYGIAGVGDAEVLARLDLSGHFQQLEALPAKLLVSALARSERGDFAVGASGYVLSLHRVANGFESDWYAPRDCVGYTTENNTEGQRCIGRPQSASYVHRFSSVADILATSSDGNWLLTYRTGKLMHVVGNSFQLAALPNYRDAYFRMIENTGSDPIVLANTGLFVRRSGVWQRIGPARADCQGLVGVTSEAA